MYLNNDEFLNDPKKIKARHASQLTDALMLQVSIPHGYGLVPYLAPGSTMNNHSALKRWVTNNVDLLEPVTASQVSHVAVELIEFLDEATNLI